MWIGEWRPSKSVMDVPPGGLPLRKAFHRQSGRPKDGSGRCVSFVMSAFWSSKRFLFGTASPLNSIFNTVLRIVMGCEQAEGKFHVRSEAKRKSLEFSTVRKMLFIQCYDAHKFLHPIFLSPANGHVRRLEQRRDFFEHRKDPEFPHCRT